MCPIKNTKKEKRIFHANKLIFTVIAVLILLSLIFASISFAQQNQESTAGQAINKTSNNATAIINTNTSATELTTQTIPLSIDLIPFITVSQCAICHGSDYDKFNNPGLIFKHDPHLARGIRCAGCHTTFPHQAGIINKPLMEVCYNCHGVSHSKQGMVATGKCTLCHPAAFKKLPKNHTKSFIAKDHSIIANQNDFGCVACHGQDFCIKCHNTKKAIPNNHGKTVQQKESWKKIHGQTRDKATCTICHDNGFCTKCHKTPMPHPTTWLGTHKKLGKQLKNDCKICHDSKKECSSCHHQFEVTTLLVQKNCERCHEDYKAPLSVLIATPKPFRNKGIIIHKAHFEMTKTDPFDCAECHDREYEAPKGCFSFNLCYECHGKMRGGSLIAKWGGQELCYRCHQRK